jgi:hypothetical protein
LTMYRVVHFQNIFSSTLLLFFPVIPSHTPLYRRLPSKRQESSDLEIDRY